MADIPGTFPVLDIPGLEPVEVIGRGGFATVYRGWQPAFNRSVAVKVLDRDPGDAAAARFDLEVRALGSLSGHPHVVAIYGAGILGDHPYLVMPYLSGGCLEDRLRTHPLAPAAAASIMAEIADAVAAAHRLGILHRDIKPANILFTAYGEPQLADFGIARFADSTLTGGLVAATVAYAAPEVLGGEPASPAADVYSLGATVFAALSGRPPFEARPGEAAIALAVRAFSEPAPDLTASGVPPALAAVVTRAMAKQPADRYPSAEAFAAALRRAATAPEGPAAASPLAPAVVGSGPARPRLPRRVLLGTAAALLLLGGGTGAAVELSGSQSPPAARVGAPATTRAPATTAPAPPRSTGAGPAPATSTPPASATLTGALPPSAGGATSAAALPAATLVGAVDAYYALVNQHRLTESWKWLTPAYQARLGVSYYDRFWNGIQSVELLSVVPRPAGAEVRIRYAETNGNVSVESADLEFAVDPSSGRILIGSYGVTG